MISERLEKVIYVYGVDDPEYHSFAQQNSDVTFTPFLDDSLVACDTLFIIDDMQLCLSGAMNDFITNFTTRTVHHSRVSVIIVVHNMYSAKMRTSCLSADYIMLFNFIRDRSTVTQLARQVFPGQSKFLKEAYDLATLNNPFGYLFFDLHQLQNPRLRIRSSIYDDLQTVVFVPS